MKSLLRRHYIIFIFSTILLVASFFGLLAFVASMSKRLQRVMEVRDRLATFEQNKRTFADEAVEFEKIRERVALLEKNILTNASIPYVLSALEEMAKTKNIDFAITTAEIVSTKGPTYLHVDFSASGTFENIEKLVDEILSQPYQTKFSRFSLYFNKNIESEAGPESVKIKPTTATWQLLAGIDIMSF